MSIKTVDIDVAKHDYKGLCTAKPTPLSRRGLNTLDYFFLEHRLRTKTKKGISFADAMASEEISKKLENIAIKWRGSSTPRNVYYAFQLWYGTVNQFRPMFARQMYMVLEPKIGILDFSAGWGGRCLAAMSLGIPYHGIDSNVCLKKPYEELIDLVEPTSPVSLQFRPAETVDFTSLRGKYDLVFTSPPYYMLEVYENMPLYKSKKDFITKFYFPVLRAVWDNLLPGGKVALNIPSDMLDASVEILGEVAGHFDMRKAARSKGGAKSFEKVYLWTK